MNYKTILYFGNYEIEKTATTTCEIHYIGDYAMYVRNNGIDTMYNIHTDLQGSILVVTDQNKNIIQQNSFNAYGRKRNPNNWNDYNTTYIGRIVTTRGYTGHEHLDEFGLINMIRSLDDSQYIPSLFDQVFDNRGMRNQENFWDEEGANSRAVDYFTGTTGKLGGLSIPNAPNFNQTDFILGSQNAVGRRNGRHTNQIGNERNATTLDKIAMFTQFWYFVPLISFFE